MCNTSTDDTRSTDVSISYISTPFGVSLHCRLPIYEILFFLRRTLGLEVPLSCSNDFSVVVVSLESLILIANETKEGTW